ncbi:hypothetical protein [Rhizobium sp. AG207R]|uniref:hypothetical protein n=1 Tax=Rhizobium sp. AG207R TaxID=2802287 RepID=UPI0022AC8EC3|nr:hypothetical protein [Rhizobium sp. AG207R]MCZ3374821.1 hypothetical protein [Rhizobium sp. AG207R]
MFDPHHLQLAGKPSWKDAEDDRGERVRDRAAVRATLALEDEVDTRRLCSIIHLTCENRVAGQIPISNATKTIMAII